MASSTPRPHFTPGKDPVPIVQEAGWAPGPVWTGEKSLPHREFVFYFKIRLLPYDCYILFHPFSFSQDSLPPYHLSLACLSFPLYALILLPLLLCSLCSSVIVLLLSHMLGCASLTHLFLFVLSGGGLRS